MGRVIDPSQGLDKVADVLINNGKVVAIQKKYCRKKMPKL